MEIGNKKTDTADLIARLTNKNWLWTVPGALREEAAAALAAQAEEIERWRECAKYDPMMSGEAVFKGWDRSALDRCRKEYIR